MSNKGYPSGGKVTDPLPKPLDPGPAGAAQPPRVSSPAPCTCGPRIEDDTHDECPRVEECYANWLDARGRVAPPEPEKTGPTIDLDRRRSQPRWERPGMPCE